MLLLCGSLLQICGHRKIRLIDVLMDALQLLAFNLQLRMLTSFKSPLGIFINANGLMVKKKKKPLSVSLLLFKLKLLCVTICAHVPRIFTVNQRNMQSLKRDTPGDLIWGEEGLMDSWLDLCVGGKARCARLKKHSVRHNATEQTMATEFGTKYLSNCWRSDERANDVCSSSIASSSCFNVRQAHF